MTYRFKIIVVGDYGVGKTTLITRFVDEKFREDYRPTLGVQFTKKDVMINEDMIELVIWDIAGQESYFEIRQRFYEQASGFFMVYDVTRLNSLKNLEKWYKDVTSHTGKIPCILIGNKIDLTEYIKVTREDVKKILENSNIEISKSIETSAKTGENVEDSFKTLTSLILDKYKEKTNNNTS